MRAKQIGQLIVAGYPGLTPPKAFQTAIEKGLVGGVILFKRNIEIPGEPTCKHLHEARQQIHALSQTAKSDRPLWVAIDQEGGRVERFKEPFPSFPPMRQFGNASKKSFVHRAAIIQAQALKLMGVHQNYAPIVDVDSNPQNPVIGDRSFGSDPALVARLASAYIVALQDEGIAASAKHFPGHGDTDSDSHLTLPKLEHSLKRLRELEFVPFRAAIMCDVATIMTAHVLFPELDTEFPVTLSPFFLGPVLRKELGYKGVIVSDDLEMNAIKDNYGIADAAVKALIAGCDQILICKSYEVIEEVHEAIQKAIEKGELPLERLTEATKRVEKLKERFIPKSSFVDLSIDEFEKAFPRDAHALLIQDLKAEETNPEKPLATKNFVEQWALVDPTEYDRS